MHAFFSYFPFFPAATPDSHNSFTSQRGKKDSPGALAIHSLQPATQPIQLVIPGQSSALSQSTHCGNAVDPIEDSPLEGKGQTSQTLRIRTARIRDKEGKKTGPCNPHS